MKPFALEVKLLSEVQIVGLHVISNYVDVK